MDIATTDPAPALRPGVSSLDLRLRVTSPGLLALPWRERLADWDLTEIPFRDIPVGPSRHLVRFVETDGALWALKDLPERIAIKEYAVLRDLEARSLPAVRAAGLVIQGDDSAILVTRYLERSWQYRRLLMRMPRESPQYVERLLDAMASLLVELHRNGVFWGDCSLANTLFSRDGQVLQAWLVDAETSEIHPRLTNGQRQHDLDILVENLAGGLLDVASRLCEQAESVAARYTALWDTLHAEPVFSFDDRYQIEGQIRALHDLGFAVDEINVRAGGDNTLRFKVAVAARRFHASQLHDLTGLDVGEGQARILLADLHAYAHHIALQSGADVSAAFVAPRWLTEVLRPGSARAHAALAGVGDPIQAYCDLLEVRWLLSEQAKQDVGEEAALEAMARRAVPAGSAAKMAIADVSTGQLPALTPALIKEIEAPE
jgi:Domain of unknown function (DUF4032)/Lipopolysaccharide kinase (Kdo/WaaP) family